MNFLFLIGTLLRQFIRSINVVKLGKLVALEPLEECHPSPPSLKLSCVPKKEMECNPLLLLLYKKFLLKRSKRKKNEVFVKEEKKKYIYIYILNGYDLMGKKFFIDT